MHLPEILIVLGACALAVTHVLVIHRWLSAETNPQSTRHESARGASRAAP
jgi:hypothetical protein